MLPTSPRLACDPLSYPANALADGVIVYFAIAVARHCSSTLIVICQTHYQKQQQQHKDKNNYNTQKRKKTITIQRTG